MQRQQVSNREEVRGQRLEVSEDNACNEPRGSNPSAGTIAYTPARVAQLVEAADLKSACWEFESLHAHQKCQWG